MVYKTQEVPVLPSDGMLIYPCEKTLGFKTPRELSINNRKNIDCIGQYKIVIDSLIDWKTKQEEIYKEKK